MRVLILVCIVILLSACKSGKATCDAYSQKEIKKTI
jgi:hypothetical protein